MRATLALLILLSACGTDKPPVHPAPPSPPTLVEPKAPALSPKTTAPLPPGIDTAEAATARALSTIERRRYILDVQGDKK